MGNFTSFMQKQWLCDPIWFHLMEWNYPRSISYIASKYCHGTW